jgi:hypothetical protein
MPVTPRLSNRTLSLSSLPFEKSIPRNVAKLPIAKDPRLDDATMLHRSILEEDVPFTMALLETPSIDVKARDGRGRVPVQLMSSSFLLRLLRESESAAPLSDLLQSDLAATGLLVKEIVETMDTDSILTLFDHSDVFPEVDLPNE